MAIFYISCHFTIESKSYTYILMTAGINVGVVDYNFEKKTYKGIYLATFSLNRFDNGFKRSE